MSSGERMRMLVSITDRSNGRSLVNWISKRGVGYQLIMTGRGTASSEMLDILGIGPTEKVIVVSLGAERAINTVVSEFSDNMSSLRKGQGIMMLLSPDAVGSLISAILIRTADDAENNWQGKENETMKNEHQHSLILISVNQGYTEEVMKTARQAGATGGTIVKARLAAEGAAEKFKGFSSQAEKEILAILAPDSIKADVMDSVNREFGLRTEAQGVLCSVPVDKAFKI